MNWTQVIIPSKQETKYGETIIDVDNVPKLSYSELLALANNWQTTLGVKVNTIQMEALLTYFYAQFFPFINESFYRSSDPDLIGGGDNFARKSYYDNKFLAALMRWGNTLSSNEKTILVNQSSDPYLLQTVNKFAVFLENDNDANVLLDHSKNAILNCLNSLLSAMEASEQTHLYYAKDSVKFSHSMVKAQTNLNSVPLPVVLPSKVDARIPDPTSLGLQQTSLLQREKHRQAFNLVKDLSRQIDSNVEFAKESAAQYHLTFSSLFDRQKNLLEMLIKQ